MMPAKGCDLPRKRIHVTLRVMILVRDISQERKSE